MLESRPVSRARMSGKAHIIQRSEMSSNTTQSSPVQGRFVSSWIVIILAMLLVFVLTIPTMAGAVEDDSYNPLESGSLLGRRVLSSLAEGTASLVYLQNPGWMDRDFRFFYPNFGEPVSWSRPEFIVNTGEIIRANATPVSISHLIYLNIDGVDGVGERTSPDFYTTTPNDSGTRWDFDNDIVLGDMTLYPYLSRPNRVISFDSNGGSEVASQTVMKFSLAAQPVEPTLAGYSLARWVFWDEVEEKNREWNFGSGTIISNITLTAQWADDGAIPRSTWDTDQHETLFVPQYWNYVENGGQGDRAVGGWAKGSGISCLNAELGCHSGFDSTTDLLINHFEDSNGNPMLESVNSCSQSPCHIDPDVLDDPDSWKYSDCLYCHSDFSSTAMGYHAIGSGDDDSFVRHHSTVLGEQLAEGAMSVYGNCNSCHKDSCATCHYGAYLNSGYESASGIDLRTVGAKAFNLSSLHIQAKFPEGTALNDSDVCRICHASEKYWSSASSITYDRAFAVVSDASSDTSYCARCHGTANVHPNTHADVPAIHASSSTGELCIECHGIEDDSTLMSAHRASGKTDADTCAICHDSTDPSVITAIEEGNKDCSTSCHDGHGDVDAKHLVVPANQLCLTCHSAVQGESATLMNAHMKGSNNSYGTCMKCHSTSASQRVKDAIAANSVTCESCHDAHGDISHDGSTYYNSRPDLDCTVCHDLDGDLVKLHIDGDGNPACAVCHASENMSVKKAITDRNDYCDACHNATAGAPLKPIHSQASVESSHVADYPAQNSSLNGIATECSACHKAITKGDGIGKADILVLHAGVEDSCNVCHKMIPTNAGLGGRSASPAVDFDTEDPFNCSNCHAVSSQDPVHTPANLTSSHENSGGNDKCKNCHARFAAVAEKDLITAHETLVGGCVVCHSSKARKAVRTAVAAGNTLCSACHHNNSPYLDWQDANEIYKSINETDTAQATPHSGYATNTAKCAVCHSAHRAPYDASKSVAHNSSLGAKDSCSNCHTVWGGGAAAKLIEWTNPADAAVSISPHSSNGCFTCHMGIHGARTSDFSAMNEFTLGPASDAALKKDLKAGNTNINISYAENGGTGKGANWFQNGTTSVPAGGFTPQDTDAAQFAAAKSTATGYTCSRLGCHDKSQFAINAWGFAPEAGSGGGQAVTGHALNTSKDSAQIGKTCGPCHPGNSAGGYRTSSVNQYRSAAAYGCDQCHDIVGRASNSTAWPHANAGIAVYQWNDKGVRSILKANEVKSGNLWMYQSNISQISTSTATAPRTNMTGIATKGSYQVVDSGLSVADGICLKCHVPTDAASKKAMGVADDDLDKVKLVPAIADPQMHANPLIGITEPSVKSKIIYQYR